jgi:hypothetical protein
MVKPSFRLNVSVNSLLLLRGRVKTLLAFLAVVLLASSATRAQEAVPSPPEAKASALEAAASAPEVVAPALLAPAPLATAQENHEIKGNNKAVMWTNAINVGASFLNASAEHYGARQCLNEGDTRIDALHGRFQRTLAISLPIDAALGFASWKLRRKHPSLALWLPATSAGLQTGFATIQYTQGCF